MVRTVSGTKYGVPGFWKAAFGKGKDISFLVLFNPEKPTAAGVEHLATFLLQAPCWASLVGAGPGAGFRLTPG